MTKKVHFEMTPIDASKACDTSPAAPDIESCPDFKLPAHFTFDPENIAEQSQIEMRMKEHRSNCPRCAPAAEAASPPERIRLLRRQGLLDSHWYYPDAAVSPYDEEIIYARVRPAPEQARLHAEKAAEKIVKWYESVIGVPPLKSEFATIAAIIQSAGVAAPNPIAPSTALCKHCGLGIYNSAIGWFHSDTGDGLCASTLSSAAPDKEQDELIKMLALRKQLDPDAPDSIVLSDSAASPAAQEQGSDERFAKWWESVRGVDVNRITLARRAWDAARARISVGEE